MDIFGEKTQIFANLRRGLGRTVRPLAHVWSLAESGNGSRGSEDPWVLRANGVRGPKKVDPSGLWSYAGTSNARADEVLLSFDRNRLIGPIILKLVLIIYTQISTPIIKDAKNVCSKSDFKNQKMLTFHYISYKFDKISHLKNQI